MLFHNSLKARARFSKMRHLCHDSPRGSSFMRQQERNKADCAPRRKKGALLERLRRQWDCFYHLLFAEYDRSADDLTIKQVFDDAKAASAAVTEGLLGAFDRSSKSKMVGVATIRSATA